MDTWDVTALLSINVFDSIEASMQSNGHVPFARSSSQGHDCHISKLTLRNSVSPSMKGAHSVAPSMTPEAHEFLAPNRSHENSSSPDAEDIAAATSSITRRVHASNVVPQFRASRSMTSQLCAPRSMAPHLRVLSRMPKVHEKSMMSEANSSSAATVVPVICKPPSNTLPKRIDLVTSSKECPTPSVILQGPDCPEKLASKLQNTPKLKDVLPQNPAAQCGANKKLPGQGVDASSSVTDAAGTLVVLSAHGEKDS